MKTRTKDIVGFHAEADGTVVGLIILAEPVQLAHCTCGRVVAFAVSRGGATRCLECDSAFNPEMSQTRLAERFGVTTNVVREALRETARRRDAKLLRGA